LGHGFFHYRQSSHPTIPGRKDRWFELTRDGFTLLAMGFTGARALEFKVAFLRRFNEMERALRERSAVNAGALSLTPETAAVIGGIVKVVVRKALNDDREAGIELVAEEISKLNLRFDAPQIERQMDDAMTAYEVIVMAEVPVEKRFPGLAGQVSSRLSKYCARNRYLIGLIDLRPGEKLTFPRHAIDNWLADGGRVFIWQLVEQHSRRASRPTPVRAVAG
jgi:hypothetical protein